jgi:hypothetical protein
MFLVLNPKKNNYRVTRVAPQWRKLRREEVAFRQASTTSRHVAKVFVDR